MSNVARWRRSSALLVLAGLVPVLLVAGSEPAAGASMSADASPKRKLSTKRQLATGDKTAPTKPGQLSVVATTASSLTISWRRSNDRTGVAGYTIYRNGVRIGSTAPATTRFTAPTLSCGSSYTLAVDAYDAAGNRSARATVLAATSPCGDTQAPSAPAGVSQFGVDASSITLSWSAASDNFGVVGYDVLRDGALAGSTASTLFAVTGLQCGTMYTLGVRAFDAAGNRSPAASVLLTTSGCSDQTAPSAPPTLGVASANETSVSLTWAQSSDGNGILGYGVYRNGTYVGSTSGTTYTVGGLSCGVSYSISVDAYDAAGNRSARSAVTASTSPCPEPIPVPPADTIPPTVPTGLTITGATASTISLRWTASSDDTGVAGYGLYRDGAGAGSSSLTNATFAGLSCGRSYQLAVDAYDARGNRSSRDTVVSSTAPCPDTTPPSTPAGLTQSGVTEFTVGLGWTAATDNVGVAGYGVYLAGVRIASTSSLAYTFAQLTCGTTYTVGVDAYDAAGSRSARASLVVTTRTCPTDTQAPTVPQNQSVSGATQSSFTMSWSAATDNVGVTGYAVHLNGARVATTSATSHTYTGLACGTSYTVGLQALDAAGNASEVGFASGPAATSACPASGDTEAPSAPGALTVGAISQSSVSVSWTPATDNVGVTGYGYYRGGSSVGNGTGSSYAFSGLACGTSYSLAVDAYDAAGNRSTRTSATATTSACPPPAPGGSTANLWVDTNGGTCTRQATRGAYSDGQACTWSAAYQAAQTGDLIQVRGGSYGDVRIGPNKASIASPGVTFQPASGESVTVSDLENGYYTGGASNITFLGPVTSRTFRSDGGSNIVVDGWTVDCGGCDNVQTFHLENASNVTVRNSDISDNNNNSLIWIQGTNLTFDNNVIHDAGLPSGSGAHTECMYAWNVTNLRLTRNHFYHCSVMDVFITGSSVANGGYVENNVFEKPWESTGRISNSALAFHFRNGSSPPTPDPNDWDFRYNTFVGPLSITTDANPVGSAGMRIIGNVFLAGGPCGHANTTYAYNAFVSGGCGSNVVTNTLATYLSGFVATGDPGTYALRSTSVLVGRGSPTTYPSVDRVGTTRPLGGAADLGAYELAG